jgi:succinyl-CoA synthetase beta subunit
VPTLAPDDGLQWRNEFEIKELLRDRGASVPANLWLGPDATSADTVIGLRSSRLAVKGISRRVAHKARWGLVHLVPNDAERALQAVTALREQAASVGVHLDGVLVEEVVDVGLDVIISVTRDPLGDVVMIGHGGSDAETGPPPGFATIPMSQLDDADLFSRARIPVEHWAAASALIRLASDFYAERELDQIEINPVRFDTAGRAWVIDALAFGGKGEVR